MARHVPQASHGAPPCPSDTPDAEAIRRFLAEERAAGRAPGKREVARAFGISGGGKIWLKRILKEIEAEDEAAEDAAEDVAPLASSDTAGTRRRAEALRLCWLPRLAASTRMAT